MFHAYLLFQQSNIFKRFYVVAVYFRRTSPLSTETSSQSISTISYYIKANPQLQIIQLYDELLVTLQI